MSTNPQGGKAINQKRGPTTGNAGNSAKRDAFVSEKASVGSERSKIAGMITDALEMRGRGQKATTNPSLEGVHSTTNVGRGPTKGNAGKR
jgi:hypothetical protein